MAIQSLFYAPIARCLSQKYVTAIVSRTASHGACTRTQTRANNSVAASARCRHVIRWYAIWGMPCNWQTQSENAAGSAQGAPVPQRVCGACKVMEAQAPVTIHGSCLAVIRQRQELVPNQRYNININSNSNSNSYMLLLSRGSDVFWTLMSSWKVCRPMFLAATFSVVNFCKTVLSALSFEWRHQNSGSYF